jgi:IclR family KDG regulon transcriptional repressor
MSVITHTETIQSASKANSSAANPYQVAAVTSAFDLLFAFLQGNGKDGEFGVSELARRSGQTKNQTFRLLQTMIASGVVIQNSANRTYSLGYRLLELGAAAHAKSNLVHAAQPTLDRLVIDTGDRVMLGQLTAGFATVLLDLRDMAPNVHNSRAAGDRFLLHAGAGSKLLLAYSTPDYIDAYIRAASPLKRFTPYTCVQASLLKEECEHIRANGFAISFQDLDLNRCSIAVPIRDGHNEVIAGISMSSSADTFGEGVRKEKLAMLMSASEEISTRLGHKSSS